MANRGMWAKPDPAMVDRFHAALPDQPAAVRRKMLRSCLRQRMTREEIPHEGGG